MRETRINLLAASLLVFGVCAALSSPAYAQKKDKTPRQGIPSVTPSKPTGDDVQTVTQIGGTNETIAAPKPVERLVEVEYFRARADNIRDTATVTHRGAIKAALNGFNFKFKNGNHQIKAIGVMNSGPNVTATFQDEDGDDPYDFYAGYISTAFANESRYVKVEATGCRVKCTIRIPDLNDGETALLAGFKFERAQRDANLRGISVEVLSDREVVNVVYYDDRGADFSGFVPVPFIDAATIANGAQGNTGLFKAEVQLLIVPEKIVLDVVRVIGTSREDASIAGDLVPTKYLDGLTRHFALMGFGITFTREDHFIEGIGVDHHERPSIMFQDSDTDDSIAWFYDLATFKTHVDWP